MVVNINDKDRSLKFNIFGIEKMQDKNEEGSSMANVYAMLWGGLEGSRYAEGREKEYTFSDVIDFLDTAKNRAEIITEVTALLLESMAYKSLIESAETEVEAKPETQKEKKSKGIKT